MQHLRRFLAREKAAGVEVYPPGAEIFAALDATPLAGVRVVIIGQDPYHGPGQAHGLCFSVRPGVPEPPSLLNIYAEINRDLRRADVPGGDPTRQIVPGGRGCLSGWAEQGVLLLNAVLTVRARQANSHQGKGWERFTDAIVDLVNRECEHVVFLLWGSKAHKKGAQVDRARHCVLSAPHPSPLSAHRGFMGCGHFSAANAYLESHGHAPIDWFDVR